MAEEKINWLARGKEYRAQGMLADAAWCFEKAVKEPLSSQEAGFLLGCVWWELGDISKAYAVWRQSAADHPTALPCVQAMAEALLHLGDAEGAAEQAAMVLKASAGEPRAETMGAIASALRGNVSSWEKLEHWAETRKDIFCDAAFAHALARAVRAGDAETEIIDAKQRFSEKCLALDIPWPPVLKMAMLSRILPLSDQRAFYVEKAKTLFDEAIPEQDSDGVRALALVLRQIGCLDLAKDFFQWYGEIQKAVHTRRKQQTDVLPLQWKRRTAGERLRVSVLLPPWSESSDSVEKRLSALLPLPYECDLWALGNVEPWQSFLGADNAAADSGKKTVRSLPASPATVLNLFDYDVLIDFAGMSWPVETFFVERSARQVWAFTEDQQGLEALSSWWDCIFETPQEVKEALALLQRELPPSAALTALTARAFVEKKDAALKAHQQEEWESARSIYEALLNDQPGMALLHYLSGMLARDRGDGEKAIQHLSEAVAALPDYAKPYQTLSGFLLEEDAERSRALVEKGLSIMPEALGLHHMEGKIAAHRGESEKAETIFRGILSVMPMNAEAHFDLGAVLQQQNRLQDAARSYQRALLFAPDLLETHFKLGQLFQDQGQLEAASRAYRHVLSKHPGHVGSYKRLGDVLAASGKINEWFENLRQFRKHCPQSIVMASQALEACQFMGDFKGVEHFLDGLRKAKFKAESNAELIDTLNLLQFQLLYLDIEPELSLRMARHYDEAMQRTFGAPLPRPQERKPGKIRVGYLSADLRDHVMGRMVWQATQHHDKEKFELFFYSLNGQQDAVTDQLRQIADHFHVLPGLGEHELAHRINADDLDILVDLSTNTKGSKPGVLALKPARVQITHIASAGTLGLSAIDFKLTDHDADLPEMQAHQIETFLPMQGCVYPYVAVETAAEHPYHRESLGIAEEAVLIGAFVMPTQLSARCVALWKQVLEKNPQSKLVFSPLSPVHMQVYQNVMKSAGIGEDRYLFLPMPTDKALRQARYSIIDFVLDPMPYGNVNGTLEPLNAGVPVVILVGRRHGERSSYSILKNLGETRTIAHSGKEYIEIAARLSQDKAFMAEVREGMRRGLEHSPLVDMKQHCRNLEEAYIRALEMKAPEVIGEIRESF
ncbi:MAG: tetratricopeptide repeat protein [Proteobacteria bacterium]|nr:tetratricopeptide repeat protein [Pseudomonadota bacterium]MCL2308158.1 tetratricopeptide repeat protein [Pseudomonadota bacterium]